MTRERRIRPLPFTNALHPSIVATMASQQAPGRDESLIAHMRGLTVAQRLEMNDAAVRAANKLRNAFARRPSQQPPSR